jgi:hypothetical protein
MAVNNKCLRLELIPVAALARIHYVEKEALKQVLKKPTALPPIL